MLIFLWHGIEMLISGEHPKHTLVLYAASSFFSILVMAPYKWDKKMDAYQDVCWNCRVRSVLDYLFNLRFNELIMNTVCQFDIF